ncbi:hypothetical protein BC830DRAFT_1103421 [Chytriomyces sp. MP71]|nr:hypothetical protein BC830DRAFT_1103421 [Chytriomyces sp. MP71]
MPWMTTWKGLTNNACILWHQLPSDSRKNMTWEEYVSWINLRFGSQLTLSQAIEAMDSLSITASGVTYPDAHLCIKYLNGLKSHLQVVPDLYKITSDLKTLQQEAECMDNLHFHCNHCSTLYQPSSSPPVSHPRPHGHRSNLAGSFREDHSPQLRSNSTIPRVGAFTASPRTMPSKLARSLRKDKKNFQKVISPSGGNIASILPPKPTTLPTATQPCLKQLLPIAEPVPPPR